MFNNATDKSLLSLLHCLNTRSTPQWDKKIRNGSIKRKIDDDLQIPVLEILSKKCLGTFITCPADVNKILGVRSPIITFQLKNLHKPLAIDIQIRDDKNVKRRFKAMTYQETTVVEPFICNMPLMLQNGWNNVTFNLKEFTRKAFKTGYVEILRIQIHANCLFKRVFFSDRVCEQEELPLDFSMFEMGDPIPRKGKDK